MPLFVFRENKFASASSSWFIVSAPHDPIITLTRDLLFQYWLDYDYLMHYFLFHMFLKMATEVFPEEWSAVPFFSNIGPHKMQRSMYKDYTEERMKYFASISDFHKLTYKSRIPSPSSIFQHVIDTYLK